MRDRGVIFSGLAVLLVLATFPAWHNLASHPGTQGPKLARPSGAKQCVAATAFMRTSHMELLLAWRDDLVRRGGREYVAQDGTRYRISLTTTCLGQCHGGKEEFCDRCHTYAAVTPSCWNCHLDSKAARLNASRLPAGPRPGDPQ
jgi:hypothetical protein